MKTAIAGHCLWLAAATVVTAQTAPAAPPAFSPATHEASFKDFHFRSGESLPVLRIRYETLGAPHRNAKGEIDNAVLLLHGTGGDGLSFMRPQFANGMFGPGQPLDIAKYYIVMIDSIGHGGSSKPSDGPRARFPHYDYGDMVEAEHRVTSEVLGIKRLRLLFGTSMGCMHAFLWAETWPDAAAAIMPMACLPVEIAGRNRVWRKMSISAKTRGHGTHSVAEAWSDLMVDFLKATAP